MTGRSNSVIHSIYEYALSLGCDAAENVPLKDYVTFRTGGPCDCLVTPKSEEALSLLLKKVAEYGVTPTFLGCGSNVLVPDEGVRGLVLRTAGGLCELKLNDEETIFCGAGVKLSALCSFALENSLSGAEFAFGIPGSCGGAAYMNAGAYGGSMSDIITRVYHLDKTGQKGSLSVNEIGYGYRSSAYVKNGCIITGIDVHLKRGDKEEIRRQMENLLSCRKEKQPLEYPSAGSTFKRPEGHFAGALIEKSGLKGKTIGGAAVSEKHAGFIINKKNATSADILELIRFVQQTVLQKTGVLLEPEVRILK